MAQAGEQRELKIRKGDKILVEGEAMDVLGSEIEVDFANATGEPECMLVVSKEYVRPVSDAAAEPVGRELLEVAEWAVYALEHGSHVEVHWLQTVAKDKHVWAREVIARAALSATQPEGGSR